MYFLNIESEPLNIHKSDTVIKILGTNLLKVFLFPLEHALNQDTLWS